MLVTIILSQILSVFCQQNKNIEIELQYEVDGSLENLKFRNVRPIPQDIPDYYEEPVLAPDLQSAGRDEHEYTTDVGRFAYRRMNMNENPLTDIPIDDQPIIFDSKIERINNSASNLWQVLEEIRQFRKELVEEAQKRIRGPSEQVIDIEQSELGLKPRAVNFLHKFRRTHTNGEKLNHVNFRKTLEIRRNKKNYTNMSTKNRVSLFPTKRSLKVKTTTLSPRDRDRIAASEIYKFLKEVSLATPRKRRNDAFRLHITRSNPKIIQEENKINAEILALSKKIDLLAAEREPKSKLVSMQSKKGNNFTLPGPAETKTKTQIIAKAIDLITSQSVEDALSQLSSLSLESETNSSQFIKTPTKSSELKYSSEYLKNSNFPDRKKQLESQLKKIRKEIDLLTAERDEKLSTVDIFTVSIRPTIILSPSSYKFSNPTTTETTTTKDETITELDIMTHKEDYLEVQNKSEAELHVMHEEKSVNGKGGREIYLRATHKSDILPGSFNVNRDLTLSDSIKQKSEAAESQNDFNVPKKQQLVLEQLNKLLNLTLSRRLTETEQDLLNTKKVRHTTKTNFGLLRLTKKRSKRPKNMRRSYKIQENHKLRDQPKHSTRKLEIVKESEIDNFRRQLQMEYDSFE